MFGRLLRKASKIAQPALRYSFATSTQGGRFCILHILNFKETFTLGVPDLLVSDFLTPALLASLKLLIELNPSIITSPRLLWAILIVLLSQVTFKNENEEINLIFKLMEMSIPSDIATMVFLGITKRMSADSNPLLLNTSEKTTSESRMSLLEKTTLLL